jgi:hypothetical protein
MRGKKPGRALLFGAALGTGMILAGLSLPRSGAAPATGLPDATTSSSTSTSTPTTSTTVANPDAAFVTFLFGRAQYQVVVSCRPPVPAPDAKSLSDVKSLFSPKGWIASPNVVVNYAARAACASGREEYATWAQLDSLVQPPDSWEPVSAGEQYLRLANLTAKEVQAESCGSLPGLAAQGFERAWGLYAFPSGQDKYNSGAGPSTGNAMADIVQHCFAFGRVYGGGINSRSSLRAPWIIKALAPIGGTAASNHGTYQVPSRIINDQVARGIGPGRWFVLQFYRFRSGYLAGDHNCQGPENTHFTSYNEEYCWEDFLTIVNAIPASALVVDPATVACAWGRLPDAGWHPGC